MKTGVLRPVDTHHAIRVTLAMVLLCFLRAPVSASYEWVVTQGPESGKHSEVYALAADGTSHRVLFQDPFMLPATTGYDLAFPVVSPDQTKIAYLYGYEYGPWDRGPIYWGDMNTGDVHPVSDAYLDVPAGSIAWTPDSRELLFSNGESGVHRIDLDPQTDDEQVLTENAFDEVTSLRSYDSLAGVTNLAYPVANRSFTMDVWGQTEVFDPWGDGQADMPYWSPDGTLAVIYRLVALTHTGIHLAADDGTYVGPIVTGTPLSVPGPSSAGSIAWAPDGQTIAFLSGTEIWSVNIDGSGLQQLTHGEFVDPRIWGAITSGDTDSDGMPDDWETAHGFDPLDAGDALLDADGDGLTNVEEYLLPSDPQRRDSDSDGFTDREESRFDSTPTDPSSSPAAGSFPDVPISHWAWHEIEACVAGGIVGGYPNGMYQPTQAVTRAQMAVYVSRALVIPSGDAAIPDPEPPPSFSDVAADHWAYKWIEYAVSRNVVQGYPGGAYHPDEVVNRGQMAVYIARAMVSPTGDAAIADPEPPYTFTDVPGPDNAWTWCLKHVEYLSAEGIVQGYWDGYRPQADVTRDQMAVYVARAFAP